MTTAPMVCPACGEWLRVAVQPAQIMVLKDRLHVQFDDQTVAHTCKKEKT